MRAESTKISIIEAFPNVYYALHMKKYSILMILFLIAVVIAVRFPYLFPHHISKTIITTTTEAAATKLSPEAYYVMYQAGTERPFSSPLDYETRKGTYVSADTGLPLFRSEDKYDSGTGWPSFTKPINVNNVVLKTDDSFGVNRTEVLTKDTGAHLGHVFSDGPEPLGKRWCMNGVALRFVVDEAVQ